MRGGLTLTVELENGDHIYLKSFQSNKIDEFIKDDDALKFQMYKTCCEETANLHFGQNWDIHWRNGKLMPTEEQYLHMIINKTSVLPRLCVRLIAQIMKEDPTEMINYVEQLGAAFQIQDDLIAIKSDIYAKERGILAEDIHEGKRTLIVSHAYRKSNMIISGGENVYPAEIENAIFGMEGVNEVAVIGIPSEKWGESPLAVVVRADDSVTEDAVLEHVSGKLARFKQPKKVEFVDVIPRNPTGKVLKRVLRDQFADVSAE